MEPVAIRTKLDPSRVAKLMEGVGRCVAIYQRIETLLKLLLPHFIDPKHDANSRPEPHWRSLIDSKQTLGPLMKKFSERANAENPEGFSDYIKRLVEQRNELIHHFFNTSVGRLRTDAEVEAAISHIRDQLRFAIPFLRGLEEANEHFLAALNESILNEESQDPPT